MAGPGGIGRWLPLQESACRRRSYAAPEASCSLAEAAGDAIRVPGLQAIVGAGSSSGQPASAALMWGKIPPCVGVPRASPPAPTTAGGTPRLLSPVGPSISTQQQGEAVSPTTAALTLSPRRVSQQQQLDPAAADAIHDYPLPFPSAGAAGDAVQASAAQGVLHLRCHGSVAVLIEQALVMAADLRVSACVCALSFGQSYVPPSRCILIRLTMCINGSTMCTPTHAKPTFPPPHPLRPLTKRWPACQPRSQLSSLAAARRACLRPQYERCTVAGLVGTPCPRAAAPPARIWS